MFYTYRCVNTRVFYPLWEKPPMGDLKNFWKKIFLFEEASYS